MKKEASEPNRDKTYLYHHILSWCGDHKMQTIVIFGIVAIASIAGIFVLQEEGTQCDLINIATEFKPSKVPMDGETSVLDVEINPQQDITDPIVIYIIPQNIAVLEIERENIENLGTKYRYLVPQQDRYKGDKFTTTFDITATCNCRSGSWDVYIEVTVGDNCTTRKTLSFIVEEQSNDDDGCLGTEMISLFMASGIFISVKKRKRKK